MQRSGGDQLIVIILILMELPFFKNYGREKQTDIVFAPNPQ
jgi:hypothetical protein